MVATRPAGGFAAVLVQANEEVRTRSPKLSMRSRPVRAMRTKSRPPEHPCAANLRRRKEELRGATRGSGRAIRHRTTRMAIRGGRLLVFARVVKTRRPADDGDRKVNEGVMGGETSVHRPGAPRVSRPRRRRHQIGEIFGPKARPKSAARSNSSQDRPAAARREGIPCPVRSRPRINPPGESAERAVARLVGH